MKKHTLSLIILLLFRSVVFTQNTFIDNFSSTLSAWNDMYGGDWNILNNELHGFYALGQGSIYHHQADLILKDQYQNSGNWKASIDFIRVADDEFPDYFQAVANFSLWLNENNKLAILVGGSGQNWGGTGTQDSIVFTVQKWDGAWSYATVSIGKVRYNWDPNEWHTASLEKRGNIYSVFINDACIGHYIDNFLNGQGKIGLHTYGTRRYDNFFIQNCTNLGVGILVPETAQNNIDIYPNPCQDYLFINGLNDLSGETLDILDIQGRLIQSKGVQLIDNYIWVKDLKNGVYILRIRSELGAKYLKFIKK